MSKKLAVFDFDPSIYELNFTSSPTASVPPGTRRLLASINLHMPVAISEHPTASGVFRLESYDLQDVHLFNTLRKNWSRISGHEIINFALLFCPTGASRGVWLAHLSNPGRNSRYSHGCHQVDSIS